MTSNDQADRCRERVVRLEKELLSLRKQAALGALATGMAHDFNNILAAISGYAELVSKRWGNLEPAAGRYAEAILQACKRAAEMVEHLKVVTRKERRGISWFEASAQIRELQGLLERILPSRYRLIWHLENQSAHLVGDREAFQGIFLHLMVMVREILPRGGVLQIRDRRYLADATQSHGYYGVEFFCDDGQLNRPVIEHIARKPTGASVSGAGFHVVRDLIEEWGGWIRWEWDSDTQLRLTLAFPLAGIADSQDILEAENQQVLERIASSLSPRILVVEDDPHVQHMLKSLLADSAHLVVCGSAEEARHKLGDSFAAALVDQGLPGEDGWSFLQEFRRIHPQARCALMSGDPHLNVGEDGQNGGITLLAKPFDFNALKSWISGFSG